MTTKTILLPPQSVDTTKITVRRWDLNEVQVLAAVHSYYGIPTTEDIAWEARNDCVKQLTLRVKTVEETP